MTGGPARAYVLCATLRSGSTMLCDLLAATGVAGRPDSYYRRQSMAWFADAWNVPGDASAPSKAFHEAYLAAVRHGVGSHLEWGQVLFFAFRIVI